MKYKAISLKQPWANLVAEGKKTIETRKWQTKYRGDLIICSSKTVDTYPAGYALCIVELYDIRPMEVKDEKQACYEIYPNAYSWLLRNLRKIDPIFPVKGQLSIFEINVPKNIKIDYKNSIS
jgi:hypothetical protein